MRKSVLLLMLVMLPLEIVWAGAALACQHEKSPTAVHFGHHVPTQSVADGGDELDDFQTTDDCAVCHLISLKLHHFPAVVVVGTDSPMHVDRPEDLSASHHPGRPERPKWTSRA